jgi:hypothetical protein
MLSISLTFNMTCPECKRVVNKSVENKSQWNESVREHLQTQLWQHMANKCSPNISWPEIVALPISVQRAGGDKFYNAPAPWQTPPNPPLPELPDHDHHDQEPTTDNWADIPVPEPAKKRKRRNDPTEEMLASSRKGNDKGKGKSSNARSRVEHSVA